MTAPAATATRSVAGTIPESGFTRSRIAPEDLTHVMGLLSTSAYTRKPDAVIRELFTNGRDATLEHRLVASPAMPVQAVRIALPTHDNASLIVADEGTGLSMDGLVEVFANYGASTRRADPTAVGEKGIGAKSPYAVADQYTVVSVKDGVRLVVLFARLEDGSPAYQVLSEGPAPLDEHGVAVSVPVDLDEIPVHEWQGAAKRVLAWLEPGEAVFVDHDGVELPGKEQPKHWAEKFDLESSAGAVSALPVKPDRSWWGDHKRSVVRMAGIAYAIPETMDPPGDASFVYPGLGRFVYDVPLGAVSPHPSRESIEDTPAARAFLEGFYTEWKEAMTLRHGGRMSAARDLVAFHEAFESVPNRLTSGGLAAVPDAFNERTARQHYSDLPEEVDAVALRYELTRPRKRQKGLDVKYGLKLLADNALVLDAHEHTPEVALAIKKWRRANQHLVLHVVDREEIRQLVDPERLRWVSGQELVDAASASIQALPDEAMVQIWHSNPRMRRENLLVSVGELRKNAAIPFETAASSSPGGSVSPRVVSAPAMVLVGTAAEFQKSDWHEPWFSKQHKGVYCVLRGASTSDEMKALLAVPTALTVQEQLRQVARLWHERRVAIVERLSRKERQAILDVAAATSAVGRAKSILDDMAKTEAGLEPNYERVDRTGLSDDALHALEDLAEVQERADGVNIDGELPDRLVGIPGMPKHPSNAVRRPLLIELLKTSYDPSSALLELVVAADVAARPALAAAAKKPAKKTAVKNEASS